MKTHEEKLLKDAIRTAIETEVKLQKLRLYIIFENIILILLLAGVLTWINL